MSYEYSPMIPSTIKSWDPTIYRFIVGATAQIEKVHSFTAVIKQQAHLQCSLREKKGGRGVAESNAWIDECWVGIEIFIFQTLKLDIKQATSTLRGASLRRLGMKS